MFPRLLRSKSAFIRKHAHASDLATFSRSASVKANDTTTVLSAQVTDSRILSKESVVPTQNLSQALPNKLIVDPSDTHTESPASEVRAQMPLRSKINENNLNRTSSPSRVNNSPNTVEPYKTEIIRELPGDDKEDVLFNTLFGARFIELNRPAKHNTLSSSMIRKIVPRMQEWAKSDMANVVIIKGCGPKAFCAGGDVVELAKQNLLGEKGQRKSAEYFALEYKLDHLIASYTKPYVAFMDGYTMGGGVGLSIHAPIRIATERTVFAMPEAKIGLFPDIGASFFLPRLNGSIGTYLALTGDRLEGVNVFYAGIATHYIHSSSLYALELRLAELRFNDYDSLGERLNLINSTIEEFVTGLPHDQKMIIAGERRKAIDRCFNKNSLIGILATLEGESGSEKSWAQETITTLQARSPTSLCVTLRLMQLGRKWTIAEAFTREHMLATRFMQKSDFNEGVDALLISRHESPKWDPPSIKDVETEARIVETFLNAEGIKPIRLLNETDFMQYPHNYGLPSENSVRDVVQKPNKGPRHIIDHFMKKSGGKQGVKVVVQEIIERKTTGSVEDMSFRWDDSV